MAPHGRMAAIRSFELFRQRAPISLKREAFNGWQPTQRPGVAVQPGTNTRELSAPFNILRCSNSTKPIAAGVSSPSHVLASRPSSRAVGCRKSKASSTRLRAWRGRTTHSRWLSSQETTLRWTMARTRSKGSLLGCWERTFEHLDSQIASPRCRAKLSGKDGLATAVNALLRVHGDVAQEIVIAVRTGEPPELDLSVSV